MTAHTQTLRMPMYYTDNGVCIIEEADPVEWGEYALDYNMQRTLAKIACVSAQ